MATRVRVDASELLLLQQQMREVASGLGRVDFFDDRPLGAPKVEAELHEFSMRWDENRGELVSQLDGLGDALGQIAEYFTQMDSGLESSLKDGKQS